MTPITSTCKQNNENEISASRRAPEKSFVRRKQRELMKVFLPVRRFIAVVIYFLYNPTLKWKLYGFEFYHLNKWKIMINTQASSHLRYENTSKSLL